MKFPSLIIRQFCKTPVTVKIYSEGLDENGAPIVVYNGEHLCNYQDKAKTIMTAEKKIVQVNGVILIPDDIVPDVPNISSGEVIINGMKRDIVQGIKNRNPDGTVNFTELDVI